MNLLAPLGLLGLLAVPLLVVLYMLRARRQEVVVSSTLLWQRATEELYIRNPLRRLEQNLLLLLQILAVAALALSMARPVVPGGASGGNPLALILDTSASMQATDTPPTRFEVSRKDALALLRKLRPGQEVMVIASAPTPRIVQGLTADHLRAGRAIRSLEPVDSQGDLSGAVTLARAQARQGLRIVLFTDGSEPYLGGPDLDVHLVGRSGENVGIVAVHGGSDPTSGNLLLLRVQNFSLRARRVPVVLYADGRLAGREVVDLTQGEARTLAFPIPSGARELRAVLEAEDALGVDNQAFFVVDPSPLPSVLLVTRGNPFLERALRVLPVRAASRTTPQDPSIWAGAEVVILDRAPPRELLPGRYLLIGTVASNLPVTVEGDIAHPAVAWQDQTHPLLRFVDLTDLTIRRSLRIHPHGGQVLAGGESPLLWIYDGKGIRAILLPFDLEDSDFALKPAFPIFLANALAWLAGVPAGWRAGEELLIPAPVSARQEALLELPSGEKVQLTPRGGFWSWRLDRAGIYSLQTPWGSRRFAANLTSPQESAIAPRFLPSSRPDREGRSPGGAGGGLRELWPLGVGFAFLLALLEWALFLRRMGRPSPRGAGRGSAHWSGWTTPSGQRRVARMRGEGA
jgi:hypothetical protein